MTSPFTKPPCLFFAPDSAEILLRLKEGLVLFRDGKPFEAHEAWEEAWNQLPKKSNERSLIQALIFACGVEVLIAKERPEAAERMKTRGKSLLEQSFLLFKRG